MPYWDQKDICKAEWIINILYVQYMYTMGDLKVTKMYI